MAKAKKQVSFEEAEKAVEDLTVQEGERSAGKENLY